MFGNRKLAKRSITGTRIAALQQDGRYYPGIIESQTSEEGFITSAMYKVRFDNGDSKEITSEGIVGQGFRQMTEINLRNGQKVFVTLNGREVSAIVITQDEDNVLITVTQMDGERREMVKRIDEVRLLESRKSARLADLDTDYSKLADIQLSEPKKRPVSHVIDVPAKSRRERRHLDSALYGSDDDNDDVDMVDEREHVAAFALTSLSSSPASPSFPQSFKEKEFLRSPGSFHDYHLSSSAASSGFESGHSERSDRSPPLPSHLSESAPAAIQIRSPTPPDDVLDLEENIKQFYDADTQEHKGLRTVFQCTWRRCGEVCNTLKDITKHVRKTHFNRDSDEELSDQEEDFYYNEVQVEMDNVTRQFAEMHTSSPPPLSNMDSSNNVIPVANVGIFDHDYQRKEHKTPSHILASSVPSAGDITGQGTSLPIVIPEGQIKRSLSWQIQSSSPGNVASSPVRFSRPSVQVRLQQHQAQSPKSHMFPSPPKAGGMHRKPRSEVRKCRKVYGMENRDSWCTQCKWKKACTRFLD
ncbi:zinc finger protein 704-like [Haliotis rufescens]|uniref:zinc finger protein 704-like n=1 Tax=Haliotis rufescens TaxID=6454 RepID=UPI001EB03991|nr:zinc finger protein 704-like [Haliotis rufescens]